MDSMLLHFLDQEYRMKAFTTEVWILAISTEALWPNGMSHWDIHQKYRVWWDYKEHSVRPLYIAFRVNGVVDSIYRVSRVEHAVPIIDLVPEMKNIRKTGRSCRYDLAFWASRAASPSLSRPEVECTIGGFGVTLTCCLRAIRFKKLKSRWASEGSSRKSSVL